MWQLYPVGLILYIIIANYTRKGIVYNKKLDIAPGRVYTIAEA